MEKDERVLLALSIVSEIFGRTIQDIRGKDRTSHLTNARHTAIHLIRFNTLFSYDEIASVFKVEHQSVIHACYKIENYIRNQDSRYYPYISKCNQTFKQKTNEENFVTTSSFDKFGKLRRIPLPVLSDKMESGKKS